MQYAYSFSADAWRQSWNYCVPSCLKKVEGSQNDYIVPVTKELGGDGKHKIANINFPHQIEEESSVPQRKDSKDVFTKSCDEVTFVYLLFTLHRTWRAQGFYGIQSYTVNDFCSQTYTRPRCSIAFYSRKSTGSTDPLSSWCFSP